MIHVIRDSPVVVAITLDELLLAGQIPIELRYILFSAKVILVMFSLHKLGCSNKPHLWTRNNVFLRESY